MEAIKSEIESALEPIKESVSKLDADTRHQFEAVRDELKALGDRVVVPTTDSIAKSPTPPRKEKPNADSDIKTWGEFFKMVGIEAMTATEAQKKENIDIRTQQIETGLQAAKDQGLGEWAVKRAGRDFLKVEASNLDALPLFPD